MCQPEPSILKAPEPSVPKIPTLESANRNPKSAKIKNLPTQTEEQQKRRLVNDQKLLEQFRAKLHLNSIQSESTLNPEPNPIRKSDPLRKSDPEPAFTPESKPEPDLTSESESDLKSESESEDAKSMASTSLLFLPAKIQNTEIHFMIDSGAANNFLSHDLVHRLDLPTNQLKPPIHISFGNGRSQSIQQYCFVRVSFDPYYQTWLKFLVADIAHDAYLGQPWLASKQISIDWRSGNVQVTPNLVIQGIRKKANQLSQITICLPKNKPKNSKHKPQILDPGWKHFKKKECHGDGHLHSHAPFSCSRCSRTPEENSDHVTKIATNHKIRPLRRVTR